MRYAAERELLVDTINDMMRLGLLDPTGGALSVRADSGDIIITATGSAFSRWKVTARDMMVISSTGEVVEQTSRPGPTSALLHMEIYDRFPDAGAIVHAHATYSLAFASLGIGVPSCVNQLDTLGEVPCLIADDTAIKRKVLAGSEDAPQVTVPEGLSQRPDIAAKDMQLIPQLEEKLVPRAEEIKQHGIGFLLYRHGAFTVARGLHEAVENLARIEMSARTAIFQGILRGGAAGIAENLLFEPEGQEWSANRKLAADA
ncbi:class II aldolase/adducin family protein [Streptomyces iconiensis]|uniref:Class II aldolase/adducin family protein n=1 Tax=Streptomyces iconiensis TaxID=1384038 RepID=A0ABT6ZX22_9ACTN|nr:class II aldolase/adducin family protein [Streptomyces iconiensis]MDJ1133624.1 class II aldolase/adducin family protein [Streptomyces iconiensis]